MALGGRVKEAREFRKLTQGELADKIGWTQQALSTMEKRDSKKSDYSSQMGDNGYWTELDYIGNGGDGYLEVNNASEDAYVIRAVGDSMFPALRSGWYIVFDPKRDPCAGEYVHIVLSDGRNMIKEFVSCQHGILTLISVNGMERMSFNCEDVTVLNPFVEIQPPSRLRDELHVLDNECTEM